MKQLLLLLVTVSVIFASWNPMVRRDSRVDQTMIQLSARYDVPLPSGYFLQPMRREPVVEFLQYALDSLDLTTGEREDVVLLVKWYSGDKTLFSRHNEISRININLDLTGDVDFAVQDSFAYGAKGIISPRIDGHLGGLSYSSEFSVWTETRNDTVWHQHNYEPYNGNPFNLFGRADTGNIRSSDEFRASVSWDLGLSKWDFGVDHLKSGPAVRNPLTLSLDAMPAAFARINLEFKWFTYTHVAAMLQSMKDYNRYMIYHRFEIPFMDNKFVIGFNETVLYGSSADSLETAVVHSDPLRQSFYSVDRSFQPVYMIPFVPFAFAEHFTGDRDNALLSLDFSLRLPADFHWYLEFLIDDMSAPHTLFSDDWGNKWGLTLGGQWFGNIAGKNLTVSTEYSRIEPWVYTHFRGVSHRYMHYGSAIGSDMGPNSALTWSEVELQINQKHRVSIGFENQRWNHETRGGSIEHVYIDETVSEESQDENGVPRYLPDSDTKEFLAGDVQSDNIVSLGWEFLPYHLFEMDTHLSYSSRNGFGMALMGGFRF